MCSLFSFFCLSNLIKYFIPLKLKYMYKMAHIFTSNNDILSKEL